jgi:hypothetical protein
VPRNHALPSPFLRLPLYLAVLALASTAIPASVQAQAPEQGTWSVGLPLFTENVGSVLNLGFMVTGRLHLGLEVNLQAAEIEEEVNRGTLSLDSRIEEQDFALGPVLKWYGADVGPVSPFLRLRGLYGTGTQQITLEEEVFREIDTTVLAAALSIGAEWFVIRQLSLSGHTGFEYSRQTLERRDFDGDVIERSRDDLGTFRSALAVTFYFR